MSSDARPGGQDGPDDTRRMSETPGPTPEQSPGLEPGGSVTPGDTPPDEGSESGAAGSHQPNVGPVSGNRTPAAIALTVIGLLVLATAALVVASFIAL